MNCPNCKTGTLITDGKDVVMDFNSFQFVINFTIICDHCNFKKQMFAPLLKEDLRE